MKIKGRAIRSLFSFAIVIALVSAMSGIVKADNGNAGSADLKVDYHTKKQIADFIKAHPEDKSYTNSYSQTPVTKAPYAIGRLSDDVLNDSINMLNNYRYIAGIPSNVTLNESYNELAQAASLVNAVNSTLTHYPAQPSDMSNEIYDLGAEGASHSNLAAGMSSIGYSLEHGWMSDSDAGNIDRVGHRRWVLNPTMSQTGFGLVVGDSGYRYFSGMYAFDRENKNAANYDVVAWPAQNTPIGYFPSNDPWSISFNEYIDNATVNVTCVNTGEKWTFTGTDSCKKNTSDGYININNDGYGMNGCIIFRPAGGVKVIKDYSYNVSVSGQMFNFGWVSHSDGWRYWEKTGDPINFNISYTVDFFDLEDYASKAVVTFVLNGGSGIGSSVKLNVNSAYGDLPTPVRKGYSFAGWYTADKGGTKIKSTDICTGDITLYARWSANTNTKYKVEHYKQKLDGTYNTTASETENLTGKTGASVTPSVKDYKGFTAPAAKSAKIKADGSLVIKYYYERNSYTLTWDFDGGSVSEKYTKGSVKYGAKITQPVPTKKGYTFAGWSIEVPEKMPAKNLKIKALWKVKYATVTFDVNGGKSLTETKRKVQENTAIGELPKTTRTGYTFSGWYNAKNGGTKVTADTVIESNVTFYAHWKAKTNTKYTVEHYKQKLDGSYTAKPGETESFTGTTNASVTPVVKTYKGYISPNAQTVKIKADGSLVVKYYYDRNSYKLTWDFAGGSADGSYTKGNVKYGAKITAPVPVREGYEFTGWDKAVPEKMPAKAVKITAQWKKINREEQVRKFVERFYTIILDRPAEAAGLKDWTNRLLTKTSTGSDVAAGFINSTEFQKKKMTDEEYVTKLYRAFFDREPDKAGYEGWLKELKNGKSRDYVLRGFINSVEFNNLCKKYGINAGSY